MAIKNMVQAINEALTAEMKRDEKVLVFGEDVGTNGGVFRVTDGMSNELGADRVFDTPLAESGIMGMAMGMALGGYRPVPEIQFSGFTMEAIDGLLGQLARHRYRMGGSEGVPVTIRSTFGGGVGTPELHSDNLEGLFSQSPGLRVVIPSGPYDAKGLLTAAIRNNDPVYFLEHLKLYRSIKEEVPEESYVIELDKANIVQEGTDITIVTYGAMVHESKKAIEKLAKDGISVELIDLRTVAPFDIDTILASVKKTGRVVVVQEAQRLTGIGNQIMAEIAEGAMYELEASIGRVAAPDSHFPFGQAESIWLPNAKTIEEQVRKTMAE
ncbi:MULTISPECIES: alpha-ketoacid dehydrogenase subunit beta [Vagococcus]|uniref:Pyruvate dehydrogenase E1 component beta subunit n=1 Tax=Vagococcus fluvialis bH819 TaxID=1255619 RepID=A0A1X6WN75_9ENTE|nr:MULTISPECIES: alpha-ketoacid dehydrogenase subunit beta [Vagococcus]SLM85698.1 Pyruvate dehydrogenase E1 component beta subunit [Vagococcus fluvialis bH819]HCM90120.1 alpha-ketoacid dehydrogenase subunit beta [Vagococcus sp.]